MLVVEVGGAGLRWWVKMVVDSGWWCWCWRVVVKGRYLELVVGGGCGG